MKPIMYSGILFIIVGLIFLVGSFAYQLGIAAKIGPGYFPTLLSLLLILLGVINVLKSIIIKEAKVLSNIAWRPLFFILLSNIIFGLFLPYAGLLLSVLILVIIASYATKNTKIAEIGVLSVVLSFIVYIIFILILNMPVPIFPGN